MHLDLWSNEHEVCVKDVAAKHAFTEVHNMHTNRRCQPWQAEFGDMYTERNVAISGIHTHSGPGGYLQYVLYDITSLGFVKQSWEAVVSGIVEVSRISDAFSGPGFPFPEA